MGSYLYFRASGRRFGLVAVVFLLASIFCVALSQGETNGSVLDLGRRSKVITPLSFCSSFHFVSVRLGSGAGCCWPFLWLAGSFYLYAHVYSFSAWMLYVCINFWAQIVLEDLEVETTGDKKDPDSISLDLSLDSGLGVFDAFFASLSMIIVSEIGDETFIIAALMAMRHPKSIVLSGALSALIVMTVLSTGLGRIVPNLISRKHTNSAATVGSDYYSIRGGRGVAREFGDEVGRGCDGVDVSGVAVAVAVSMKGKVMDVDFGVSGGRNGSGFGCGSIICCGEICPILFLCVVLYAFFGLRLLYIAWRSDSKASQKKEMEEVEEKLESGQGKTSFRRFFSRFCTPIFLESFILTFLAEWGDRSQIATIALLKGEVCECAAGNTQECDRSSSGGNNRAHNLHITGSGGRKHASIQDLPRHSCNSRRPALPGLFPLLLLLSSSLIFVIA
ncbi:GDT1-like protein 4 [Vitis vinifera]|uniref:GDT1-like protein 4 n=1 Tax=Vitis vinifera TaxID=29760 RepID=A0A438JE38_VITVI|nr:GDT1-like protein 4 [Vitis vinifera]